MADFQWTSNIIMLMTTQTPVRYESSYKILKKKRKKGLNPTLGKNVVIKPAFYSTGLKKELK